MQRQINRQKCRKKETDINGEKEIGKQIEIERKKCIKSRDGESEIETQIETREIDRYINRQRLRERDG